MIRYSSHFADPVVLVTVAHEGKANVMTAAWATPVSFEPPILMVSISPKRYTHDLIVGSGEFGVSILADDQKHLSTIAGTLSGAKVNKLERPEFETFAGEKISAPLIAGARAWYECRLHDFHTIGDHTAFYGEVLASRADQSKSPLVLYFRHYYRLGEEIGAYP